MDAEILAEIRRRAVSENWEIRESAADRIKALNDKQFDEYLTVWQQWVLDPDPNIRRAVEVGLLRIPARHYPEAMELLTPLLPDANPYVRRNCGPFALSAVAFRDPEESFRRFIEMIKSTDPNVRWNIAMCLGVMFGTHHPERSLSILKMLAQDERRFVWRAAASSLIKLLRRYPEYKAEVYAWKNADHVLKTIHVYLDK